MTTIRGLLSTLLTTWMFALSACGSGSGRNDADTDTDSDSGTDTEPDTTADTNMDEDTFEDADADADADTDVPCTDDGPCTSMGLICSKRWGICVVASCVGEDDFTPCETVTSSDRSYDICVDGVCVSPGCGDVTCNVTAPHFPMADTNQRLCYDDILIPPEIPCPSPSDYLYGQDAQFGWDVSHSADIRFTCDVSSPGNPMVIDNVTGLIWQGCPHGFAGDECETGGDADFDWQAGRIT